MADLGTEAASVAARPILLHAAADDKLSQSNYSAEVKHREKQLSMQICQGDPDWLSLRARCSTPSDGHHSAVACGYIDTSKAFMSQTVLWHQWQVMGNSPGHSSLTLALHSIVGVVP